MKQIKSSPKRNNSWIIWIFIIVVILAIGVFFNRKDRKDNQKFHGAASDAKTIESKINNNWSGINPNIPVSDYEELKDTDLHVRATDNYAIYNIKEAVLFDPGKYNINPEASQKLKQIASSAEKRFAGGPIRIYGYTDSTGSKQLNKELSAHRAAAVKSWLVENSGIKPERITFYAEGEANPFLGNSTKPDLQQNRRVEIVILKKR